LGDFTLPAASFLHIHKPALYWTRQTAAPTPNSNQQSIQTDRSATSRTISARPSNYALRPPRTLPCPLQQLRNNLRGGGGVMWEPPTLIHARANHSLETISC
jgi:hypothetical protein